jgi:lipopolysaccharide/colanic/teichoic acid biosynthesis glycosyltransferase
MWFSNSADNSTVVRTHPASEGEISFPLVRTFYALTGKRLFDVAMAALGILLLLPFYAALGVFVKLGSPGSAIYWQRRVGRGGRIFKIAKFRTMYKDADQKGLSITSAGDARVTSFGRILRRFKLDELPQLWNVLNGDMSLVGPRPEVPCYVAGYSMLQKQVLLVRPGITDLASILYRHEEAVLGTKADPEKYYRETLLPHKLEINLQYLSRVSFMYDLMLVLRTLGCILGVRRDGAKHRQPFTEAATERESVSDASRDPGITGPKETL